KALRGGSPREGARSEVRAEQRLAAGGRRLPRPGRVASKQPRRLPGPGRVASKQPRKLRPLVKGYSGRLARALTAFGSGGAGVAWGLPLRPRSGVGPCLPPGCLARV